MGGSPQYARRNLSGYRQLILSVLAIAALILAFVLSGCSAFPDAADEVKTMVEGEPAPTDARLVDKAYGEIEHGNYTSAEVYLDAALEINPNNPFALLNLGFVYEKTGREDEARAIYTTLIRQNPPHIAERAGRDNDTGRRVVDIAADNLAALDRNVVAMAARGTNSPLYNPPMEPQQDLESDWRARMDQRIAILEELKARGYVSDNEMMARIGGAWALSHTEATPRSQDLLNWLSMLDSLQRRGMIAPDAYAKERSAILDQLAPLQTMPANADAGMMQASAPPPNSYTPGASTSAATATPPPAPMTQQHAGALSRVHLASYRSEKAAHQGWFQLKARNGDLLADLEFHVDRVELGGNKGTFYRLSVGPIDHKAAETLCGQLKQRTQYCEVKG